MTSAAGIDHRINAARELHRAGRTDEAIAALREILRDDPGHRRCRGTLGCLLSDAGGYREAVEIFGTLAEENPHDAITWINMAIVVRRMSGVSCALPFYRRASENAPDRTDLRIEEIGALLECGASDDAKARLAEMNAACSPTAAEWRSLGVAFGRADQYATSKHCLDRSIQLDPRDPKALADLAGTLNALDELDDAERYALRALAINPADAIAMCNLGLTEEKRGRLDASLAWYERAARADPSYERATAEAARVRAARGRSP